MLGKSHENLRLEKNKCKDLQAQNEMLQKTVGILESTVEQVKHDKEQTELENARLKEYLQARDLDVDVQGYQSLVASQGERLGRPDIVAQESNAD